MKNIVLFVSMFVCLLAFSTEAGAQVRKKTASRKAKEKKEATVSFTEKLNPEIKLGNVGFFNGFNISTKMDVGYKIHDRFTLGGGGKLFFDQFVVNNAPDPSVLDIGGFVYGRGKITNEIYLQAEYAFMSYGKDPDGYNTRRFLKENTGLNYPLFGLGYMSGTNKWRFGIELMYIASETARDYQNSIIEYWFGASYNF